MKTIHIILLVLIFYFTEIFSVRSQSYSSNNAFCQLASELPTPNNYRTSSGAPGQDYWQQRADYDIQITLDDEYQKIYGSQTITYFNNSPHELTYLWVQLDQNDRISTSDSYLIEKNGISTDYGKWTLRNLHYNFDGGFKLDYVRDAAGKDLHYVINNTMMRIDLPEPLKPKTKIQLKMKWWYNISSRYQHGGRSGYEYFENDGNYEYFIAQFHPRMAVYSDAEGWKNKQFLGSGEYTLCFGNFTVSITAPDDHVVAATGELQNTYQVLSHLQQMRLKAAKAAKEPIAIIDEEEALKNEKSKSKVNKTWKFYAENVRDFAFASSRKFIWDAKGVQFGNRTVMAMSFYPKEAAGLWSKYSTKLIEHAILVYSRYTFDYPYPVVQAICAADMGMEYPMIAFCSGRPEPDGTYPLKTKQRVVEVIIHEVGHNFFPMIVNSDERQWTWMDEGFNNFLEYCTEQEWERFYPSDRMTIGRAINYMRQPKELQNPIMTHSEQIIDLFGNAYGKASAALIILRETIMGQELFDFAFKEYACRWKFKHPEPADFFRTMEDASAMDLDWFWRGWFYTTDHVDIAISDVKLYRMDTKNPEIEKPFDKEQQQLMPVTWRQMRSKENIKQTYTEKDTTIGDFYSSYDPFTITELDKKEYQEWFGLLNKEEKKYLELNYLYYEVHFSNIGGLVMPIILKFEYEDGTSEVNRIPVEIWQLNNKETYKTFAVNKKIRSIIVDPYLETADINTSNNTWTGKPTIQKFNVYDYKNVPQENPMQRTLRIKN
jgi:hypothetical protein